MRELLTDKASDLATLRSSAAFLALDHLVPVIQNLSDETGDAAIQEAMVYFCTVVEERVREVCNGEHQVPRFKNAPRFPGSKKRMSCKQRSIEAATLQHRFTSALDITKALLEQSQFSLESEAVQRIARASLMYSIREFDPEGSISFEDWMRARITLCVESLLSSDWRDTMSAQVAGDHIIYLTTSSHRTRKNEGGFYQRTHNEEREQEFESWCSTQNILGSTHEQRVLAATIRFTPTFLMRMVEQASSSGGAFTEADFQRETSVVNKLLWTYDPRKHGDDFLQYVTQHVFHAVGKKVDEMQQMLLQWRPAMVRSWPGLNSRDLEQKIAIPCKALCIRDSWGKSHTYSKTFSPETLHMALRRLSHTE